MGQTAQTLPDALGPTASLELHHTQIYPGMVSERRRTDSLGS